MGRSLEQLRAEYTSQDTPSLLRLAAQGGLTPEAELILDGELRARGFGDRKAALDAAAELPAVPAPGADPGGSHGSSRAIAHRVHWIFVGTLAVGGALFIAIGGACAPMLWRTPADQACQRAGYWYATLDEVGNGMHCERWGFERTR